MCKLICLFGCLFCVCLCVFVCLFVCVFVCLCVLLYFVLFCFVCLFVLFYYHTGVPCPSDCRWKDTRGNESPRSLPPYCLPLFRVVNTIVISTRKHTRRLVWGRDRRCRHELGVAAPPRQPRPRLVTGAAASTALLMVLPLSRARAALPVCRNSTRGGAQTVCAPPGGCTHGRTPLVGQNPCRGASN